MFYNLINSVLLAEENSAVDDVEFNFSYCKHLSLVQFHSCASDSCNLAYLNNDYLCLISIAVKTLVFPAAGNLNSPVLFFLSKLIAVKSFCFHFRRQHLLRQGDSRPCQTLSYCTSAGLRRAPDKQNNKIECGDRCGG